MARRHGEGLARLAELGLELATALQGQAMAAVTDGDRAAAADLALAFQRVSRSVRQTYALEARLERERRAFSSEDAKAADRQAFTRTHRKSRQIRRVLTAEIWNERESDEAEALLEDLEGWIADAGDDDNFLEEALDATIARIRTNLGLPANDPDGPAPDPVQVTIWKSSG